jgi:phage terminase large subunit
MIFDVKQNHHKLFTGVFSAVRRAKTRYVVVYGGAGSSKSYSVHQNELIDLLMRDKGDTLVIRKYGADLRESCFKLFKQLIDGYHLRPFFKYTYSNDNRRISLKSTGCSLVFKGVDDPEKLKSIVGIKRIIIEEASQLTFDDFLELNRRARGMEGIQIIFILNPISENHWIKTNFCDEHGAYYNETTALRFTYRDNCNGLGESFLTEADIRELERLKNINENQYRIYVEAQWGIDNKEGKFCWAFDRSQVKPTELDP